MGKFTHQVKSNIHARLARAVAALLLPTISMSAISLVENSPFIPANFSLTGPSKTNSVSSAKRNPAAAALEFRGIYTLDGESFINIFNNRNQKGTWVKLMDSTAPFHVVSYNAYTGVIKLDLDGTLEEMALKKSSDKPLPVNLRNPASGKSPIRKVSTNQSTTTRRQSVVRRRVVTPRSPAPQTR